MGQLVSIVESLPPGAMDVVLKEEPVEIILIDLSDDEGNYCSNPPRLNHKFT